MEGTENILLFDRFSTGKLIGRGAFGSVCKGLDTMSSDHVAIKYEKYDANKTRSQLAREADIYKQLRGSTGIPAFYHFGQFESMRGGHVYNILVTELMGNDLQHYLRSCEKFSLKTVLMIANQIISLLEYLHKRGFIHRDIKPENFVMGRQESNKKKVYLIDFGLTNAYRKFPTKKHIEFKERNNGLIGTALYASIHAHEGSTQSRRDDLESFAYMMIYLASGSLPWQHVDVIGKVNGENETVPARHSTENNKFQNMLNMKREIRTTKLCKNLPSFAFEVLLKYTRNLGFKQQPDYVYIKKLFQNEMVRNGYAFDFVYDWMNQEQSTNAKKNTMKRKLPLQSSCSERSREY